MKVLDYKTGTENQTDCLKLVSPSYRGEGGGVRPVLDEIKIKVHFFIRSSLMEGVKKPIESVIRIIPGREGGGLRVLITTS